MKGILIIKKEHSGPKIPVCDCVAEKAKDGDEVEVTVKGIMRGEEGKRFIEVAEVDGETVEEMIENSDHDSSMDSEDALMNFMQKLEGK